MVRNKRLIIALVFAVAIAAVFWTQSRVPALTEKAQMGLRTNFGSIAFDIVLPVSAEQNVVERTLRSTVNWAYTNWKGMTFGLLFAAAALTVLGNVRRRSFRNPWLNTLSGVLVGAPLGVCVNCATPIAHGIYAAGARLETALAALISSPTLNAIVLTMAFTLLPWEIALAKLLGVFVMLGTVPFLVRRFAGGADTGAANAVSREFSATKLPEAPPEGSHLGAESYVDALMQTTRVFVTNLAYIVRVALPLMLLAGFLGALVVELVPFRYFADAQPGLLTLAVAALVATFLPVPIAFDVIATMALLANGIDVGIATVLLFSLGIYSIYPAFVIARNVSLPLSAAMAGIVAVLAVSIGLATGAWFERKTESERLVLAEGLAAAGKSTYRTAIGICNQVPDTLQFACFAQHVGGFKDLVTNAEMCRTPPSAVDPRSCNDAVYTFDSQRNAIESASVAPCDYVEDTQARSQCRLSAVLSIALKNHDIDSCNQLDDPDVRRLCRMQYLNSSMLFYPDTSICAGLAGQELSDCQVNLAIYNFADTRNLDGCADLPDEAQDYCRYVIASSMIGRSDDASGCAEIRSPERAVRCRSLLTAWRATRESSFEICTRLDAEDLRNTCFLKVADQKISMLLADHALAPAVGEREPGSAAGESDQERLAAATKAPSVAWEKVGDADGVELAFARYRESNPARSGADRFSRTDAADFGIDRSWNFRATDFFEPFIFGKGIASGDINGDTWPDIALATERGALLYRNVGGRFTRLTVEQGELADANLFLVAFVDADGDGRQDLFASAYGGRNYLLLNRAGDFSDTELVTLGGDHRVTLAAGFADLDRDGSLDIALGNWSSGVEKMFSPEASANKILFRQTDSYRALELDGVKGETLSVLLADIDGDDSTEVLFANDRTVPDMYFELDGAGNFAQIPAEAGVFPVTALNTMSLDAADFDNDLRPDLFSTDMSFSRSSRDDYCSAIAEIDVRSRCAEIVRVYAEFQDGSAASCAMIDDARSRRDCYAVFSVRAAKSLKDPRYCGNLPRGDATLLSLCNYLAAPVPVEDAINVDLYTPQVQRNVMLMNEGEHFADVSREVGVDSSYWSWNAKAADLDNDEWQDIYVGNGFHFGDSFYEIQPNVMFHNLRGRGFEDVAADWGLDDVINTPSYTYVDLDLDGDLDIVATGVLMPPRVFVNGLDVGNSITIILQDSSGNTSAIGARVEIRYAGPEARRQRQEVTLSGGFMSFDNPVAHFGLGPHEAIDELTVHWPDGEITQFDTEMPANGFYRVRRR